MDRPLYEIAREIRQDWRRKDGTPAVNYAAEPYLRAMEQLDSVKSSYGFDPGDHIVRYFLSNASGWRGDTAKRVKAELKAML